jgi:peptidoglycan/LPS O-acetylase OafA/YrhL
MHSILRVDLKNVNGHLKELDGLRGIAILLVICFHIFPYLPMSKIGWVGVDLFFVLSGFLITGILLDSVHKTNYWRSFVIKRTLRIFPLYYFTLGLFILLCNLFPEFGSNPAVNYSYFSSHQAWYWSYLTNIRMFIEGDWLGTYIFNPFWSLAIEEQFYVFWPLIVYVFRGKKLVVAILCLAAACILTRFLMVESNFTNLQIYVFTFSRLDTILFGSLIAVLIRMENWRPYLEKYASTVFIVTGIVVFGMVVINKSLNPYLKVMQSYGYTLIVLLFSSLLPIIISTNSKHRFLKVIFQNRLLVFFGKYSYSLYIFHWPFYLLMNDPLKRFFESYVGKTLLVDLGASVIIFLASIAASLFTWNLFEKHFIRLKSVLAPDSTPQPQINPAPQQLVRQ